jgi:nitrogen regulatory protein PII
MSYLVIFVIDEIEHCPSLFDAWEAIGVTGVTILESTGLGRIRRAAGYRDDLPLMPSIRNLLQAREEHHRTLMVLVKDKATIDKLITATESVVGSLNEPHRGVLFVLPVLRVIGVEGWDDGWLDEA